MSRFFSANWFIQTKTPSHISLESKLLSFLDTYGEPDAKK
jgi:hypothetical protein